MIEGTKTKTVPVAVIGVGHLGKHHARIYHENIPEAQLVCVVDKDPDVARTVAEQYGVEWRDSYYDLPPGVQAVSVVTPTETHHEIARALLARGYHVMVEKPIALTVAQAEEMIDAAELAGRVLQVGHVERFNSAVIALEQLLDVPRFVEAHRLAPFSPRVKDVGVILDLMIHDLDLILALVNSPVETIDAVGIPVLTAHEDIANARLSFTSGCVANVTVSRVSLEPMRKIRIFQQDAYFSLDYSAQELQVFKREFTEEGRPRIIHETVGMDKQDALTAELASFLACVREGHRPKVGGQEGRNALALADSITKAVSERLRQYGEGLNL